MKKRISYSWVVILALFVTLEACQGHTRPNSTSHSDSTTVQGNPDPEPNGLTRAPDTVSGISPTADSAFMHTWRLFVQCVKHHDRQQLKQLIVFPLIGAGACYLPHDRRQDPENDTTGITEKQFDSLYQDIFDPQAVQRISAPLSENDPILRWQDTGSVSKLIARNSDPGTRAYGYHIESVKDNREGGKYFVFARLGGRYKLVALLCDGALLY